MSLKEQFEKVMGESVNMALATSAEGRPNVRIVTFAYDPAKDGKVFFTTFKGSQKIKEFAANPNVACMPLPESPVDDVQVRIFGTVRKSDISLDEVVDIIARKFPGDAETFKDGGPMIDIYEICFTEAYVAVGMDPAEKIAI